MINLFSLKKQTLKLTLFSVLALGTVNCTKKQVSATTSSATVTSADYQSYVGRYEFQIDEIKWAEVTLENNRLYGESDSNPKTELINEGKDSFKVEGLDAKVTFTRDSNQKVTGLVLLVQGNEINGKKVK